MAASNTLVLFIVGPTAVGKSALALHVAKALGGEIINADSRQIYRHMDIGTSKPSTEDRAAVRHHLVDIRDPDQEFNLAAFLELARDAIQSIHGRGKLPVVAGGAGQYIWALLEGWQVPQAPPDDSLRQELGERAKLEGAEALHEELRRLDPESAARIDPRNVRRTIRTLEIYHATGLTPSTVRLKLPPEHESLILGITTGRKALYDKIDRRVDQMLDRGLVDEVRGLLNKGYSPGLTSMSGLGYKQMVDYLREALSLEEAAQRVKYETHRFARHQYAWFRPGDPRIRWLKAGPRLNSSAAGMVARTLVRSEGYGRIASATEERPR